MLKKVLPIVNLGSGTLKLAAVDAESALPDVTPIAEPLEIKTPPEMSLPDIQTAIRSYIYENLTFSAEEVVAIAARSPILPGAPVGVFELNRTVIEAVDAGHVVTPHAVNRMAHLVVPFAEELKVQVLTADAISSISPNYLKIGTYTGIPGVFIPGLAHYLNCRYVAYLFSSCGQIPSDQLNAIIVHAGGGISVCLMIGGDIVYANNANETVWCERAGSLPTLLGSEWVWKQFQDGKNLAQVHAMLLKECGFKGHTGATNYQALADMVRSGDSHAAEVMSAMHFGIASEILKAQMLFATLARRTYGVILTGGIAQGPELLNGITGEAPAYGLLHFLERYGSTDICTDYAGSFEDQALATHAIRALRGEVPIQQWTLPAA